MPTSRKFVSHLSSLSGSVFTKYAKEISAMSGKIYPFHIGDTYMEPAVRMEDLSAQKNPGMHRYTKPQGYPPLLNALEKKHNIDRSRILISAGATGGLHVIASSVLEPDDEVLILAPFWPLIAGIVTAARGKAISVPFYGENGTVEELLGNYVTEKTVAVYINTPNNPSGKALEHSVMVALAEFSRKHDLWIWTDEVYASLCYTKPHVDMTGLAPERTFAVYSFSKVYGMAGNRCGYILCPNERAMIILQKATTYSYYSVSTASQIAAERVLTEGQEWLSKARELYTEAGIQAAAALGVPRPDGGTFLFLDLTEKLSNAGHTADDFLLRCIHKNMLLAPGASFGHQYAHFIRICFTATPLPQVMEGIGVLQSIIDEY
jgi:aspartate/methionine/tyrosine aminotransferase